MLFSSCSKNEAQLEIEFDDFTPTAYVGVEYDFSEVLFVEDGVKYKIDVYYQDITTMEEKTLPVVDDFYFTPIELFDISVVVTATKGSETAKRTRIVPVTQKGDPIDELLMTGGYAGYNDVGLFKELVSDSKYIKGENSHTALLTNYRGVNQFNYGATVLALNNFRLLDCWTDKTWENAVLRMWIFNPTEYDFEFQLRIVDKYTGLVDWDWGQQINKNVDHIAKKNEWTELVFSLRHYGIEHTLFENEDGTRRDSLNLKVKWKGVPSNPNEAYSYSFYIDDVDIVPFDGNRFPNLDTKNNTRAESIDYGWENMKLDEGYTTSNVQFDREVVNSSETQQSLSSMILTFHKQNPDPDNGYAVMFSPQFEYENEDFYPSFRHGVLEFDVMFSNNITNRKLQIIAIQNNWTFAARETLAPSGSSDEWIHIAYDFGDNFTFDRIEKNIRFGFGFIGIGNANKSQAVIHLDNIKFVQNAGTPERPALESLNNGWENMAIDAGWSGSNQVLDYENVRTTPEHPSTSSLKMTFANAATTSVGYSVTLAPEFEVGVGLLNIYRGTIDFDIKYSDNILDKTITLVAVQKDWLLQPLVVVTPTDLGDGWMHVTYNFETNEDFANINQCVRISFGFNGVNDSNSNSATVNLDNIIFKTNV